MNARVETRRPWGALGRMGIVAGMHVAIVFVVAGALVIHKDVPPKVLEGVVIDEPPMIDDPPPIPNPTLPQQDIYVPRPVDPQYESDTPPPDVISAQELPPPGGEIDRGGSADPVPVIHGVRQDPRRPLSQPAYPPEEIRAGNEGNADVEVYVLPNGRVADARISRSTGHARLDQAAIDEAKRNWRLMPATRDGVAIPQWYRVRVVFRITNR